MDYEQQATLHLALSSPSRLALLDLLVQAHSTRGVLDLTEQLHAAGYDLPQSEVSVFVTRLTHVGLLTICTDEDDSRYHYYSVQPGALFEIGQHLLALASQAAVPHSPEAIRRERRQARRQREQRQQQQQGKG